MKRTIPILCVLLTLLTTFQHATRLFARVENTRVGIESVVIGKKDGHTNGNWFPTISYTRYFNTDANVCSGTVLVLISGFASTTACFDPIARYIASKTDIEVWTINRQETLYENRKLLLRDIVEFKSYPKRRQEILGRMNDISRYCIKPRAALCTLGFRSQLEYIDNILEKAFATHKNVFLGGWSDGVEYVMAYSCSNLLMDRKEARRMKGLVMLDENPEWGRQENDERIAAVKHMTEDLNIRKGRCYITTQPSPAIHYLALVLAHEDPDGTSPLASQFKLPLELTGRGLSNRAMIGWIYDRSVKGYPPANRSRFAWLIGSGDLSTENKPGRDPGSVRWKSYRETGELSDIDYVVETGVRLGGFLEFFYPRAVIRDYWKIAVSKFNCPEIGISQRKLGKVPIFFVQSSMNNTGKSTPAGLSWYLGKAGIPRSSVTMLRLYRFAHMDLFFSHSSLDELFTPLIAWIKGASSEKK